MITHKSNSQSSIGIALYNAFWFQVIIFLIIVVFLTFAPSIFAATKDERNAEGKQFADLINSGIGDKARNTDTSNIPQYQGENVPAKDYYNSGVGIEDEALVNSVTDPTANYINDSRNNRPQFNINPEADPLFKSEDDIVSLSRSLIDTYSGCVALPVGNEDVTNRHVDLCGDILNCPDGNCTEEYKTQKDATEDFKEAATGLAVAGEIAKQFDFENLSVFKGDGKKCEKDSLGFSNCCKDSGWDSDLGLSSCSTEEKELGVKREQEATHYVGRYCSVGNIFVCYKHKYTYCTYPSKLARIIVEQGSSQMGRDYGTAKDPDCPGFTIDELNALNFNAMDLTEFYEDVTEKAAAGTRGDPNQVIQDIADRLNRMETNQ
jgi:hypothetical protein